MLALRCSLGLHVVEFAPLVRQVFVNVFLASSLVSCCCLSCQPLLLDLVLEDFIFLFQAVERLLVLGLLDLAFFDLLVAKTD